MCIYIYKYVCVFFVSILKSFFFLHKDTQTPEDDITCDFDTIF